MWELAGAIDAAAFEARVVRKPVQARDTSSLWRRIMLERVLAGEDRGHERRVGRPGEHPIEPRLRLPPLRDRAEDIPDLIDHFVRKFCDQAGKELP